MVSDEEVISLSHAKIYLISDSVLCLGKMNQNPESNSTWEENMTWLKSSSQYRTLDTIYGEPMEFEWNIFPGYTRCSSATKFKSSCLKLSIHQSLKDESSSCRCSMTSDGDLKTLNRSAMLAPTSFLYMQEVSHQEDGHSSDFDQKRSGNLLMVADHKEIGTESLN